MAKARSEVIPERAGGGVVKGVGAAGGLDLAEEVEGTERLLLVSHLRRVRHSSGAWECHLIL